jgi:hypothetical protein
VPSTTIVLDEHFVLVQIARTLPATDAGWITTTRIDNTGGSFGLGPVMGEAVLQQDFGVRTEAGTRLFRDLGMAPDFGRLGETGSVNDNLAGAIVRLLKNVTGGSVTIGTATFEPFWWGVCRGPIAEPDGETTAQVSGTAGWRCVGIESVLDQICIGHGRGLSAVSGTAVRLGNCPPFNANPSGDRSGSTYSLTNGTAYVHVLSTTTSFTWTAAQILTHLLAEHTSGWTWAVSDPDGCLDYEPDELSVRGLTLFQVVNILASQDRACTWYVTVSGSTSTINIVSTSAEAVTFGDVTIPPSTYTTALDLRGNPYVGGCSIAEDWDSVYDIIEAVGARPWRAVTLLLDSSYDVLVGAGGGWTSERETAWNTEPTDSGTDNVWRRFTLATDWNGQQYNQSGQGIRNRLGVNADGGYDGTRTYDTGADIGPAWTLEFTRMLPCPFGFGTGMRGERQPPVIVVGTEGDWRDMSQLWRVQLDSDGKGSAPYVHLDDGRNGQDIQAAIQAGEKILITVGIREIDPLIVSWHRPAGERPNAQAREKTIPMPNCEEWTVCPGTVRGVTTDGTDLDTTSIELEVASDLPKMEAALALTVAGLSVPSVSVNWDYRGILDISSAYRPGRLLTTVTRGDRVQTVNSVITRKSWSFSVQKGEGDTAGEVVVVSTHYSTQRLPPTIEALT